MLKNIFTIILILCCMALFAIPSLALNFQPGKYEITSKVEMPGMRGTIPPQIVAQCITEQNPIPNQNPENQGCKVVEMNQAVRIRLNKYKTENFDFVKKNPAE